MREIGLAQVKTAWYLSPVPFALAGHSAYGCWRRVIAERVDGGPLSKSRSDLACAKSQSQSHTDVHTLFDATALRACFGIQHILGWARPADVQESGSDLQT